MNGRGLDDLFSGGRYAVGGGAEMAGERFGIPTRPPGWSEREFFRASGIPGYAADDGAVVMNPEPSIGVNMDGVAMNEASRALMRRPGMAPSFGLTADQVAALGRLPHYATASDEDRRATIAARLMTGDPSAGGPASSEQEQYLRLLRLYLGLGPD